VTTFSGRDISQAIIRVAAALEDAADTLGELDRQVGDGDLGITATKIAGALRELPDMDDTADVGAELMRTAMAINKVASSSFGTLLAGALLGAGKAVRGATTLSSGALCTMLEAADAALQERGGAQPGDKTVIDVVHPAAAALRSAQSEGASGAAMALMMVNAARSGRDSVTPLRNRIGRASWVGERTEGVVDPGTQAGVVILEAIAGIEPEGTVSSGQ